MMERIVPTKSPGAQMPARAAWLQPNLCFWLAGLIVYGGAALNFAAGHFLDQTSRDLWQHLATLRVLIEDPASPANPFVASNDPSRHFHPYWLAMAHLARLLGWDAWQALAAAAFVSAGALLAGIWTFGRAFYRSDWGPLALLAAMVLGWLLPISHTGYHSMSTLIEGIAYPAALLIGLSLLLWALVIGALAQPWRSALIVPLAAFMMVTHPLGAVIGFVGAGWFALLWPGAAQRARALAIGAVAAGIVVAEAWPYFSPIGVSLSAGGTQWQGGLDFYAPLTLLVAFVPSAIGIIGLRHKRFRRHAWPVVAALATFLLIFAIGAVGPMIAKRFIMPAVLLLQVGLGALLLVAADQWAHWPRRRQLACFGALAAMAQVYLIGSYQYLSAEAAVSRARGSAYANMAALTADLPDAEPVAAYDVAAWPLAATGQRVASVPWPEPGIPDLAARQAAVERLFDPALGREERRALAERLGVRALVLDREGPLRRLMPRRLIETLTAEAIAVRAAGPFLRFDLR